MSVGEGELQNGLALFKGAYKKANSIIKKPSRSKSPGARPSTSPVKKSPTKSPSTSPYPLAKGSYPVMPRVEEEEAFPLGPGSRSTSPHRSPSPDYDDEEEDGLRPATSQGRGRRSEKAPQRDPMTLLNFPKWVPWDGVMKNYSYPSTDPSYPGQDVYNGQWGGGMRHGVGTCVYRNGDVYSGQWAEDKWDGEGTYTYQDGTEVYGPFTDNFPLPNPASPDERCPPPSQTPGSPKPGTPGVPAGLTMASPGLPTSPSPGNLNGGKLPNTRDPMPSPAQLAAETNTYKAALKDTSDVKPLPTKREVAHRAIFQKQQPLQGQAKFEFLNGGHFDGEWRDGEPWEGVMAKCPYFQEPVTFEGKISEGKRTGRGVAVYKNSDRYEGDWKANLRQGKGVLVCGNQRGSFTGYFQHDEMWDGMMEGLVTGNGDRYSGTLREGKKSGDGILWYMKGGLFRGEFRNDRTYQGKMEPTAVWGEIPKKKKGIKSPSPGRSRSPSPEPRTGGQSIGPGTKLTPDAW